MISPFIFKDILVFMELIKVLILYKLNKTGLLLNPLGVPPPPILIIFDGG